MVLFFLIYASNFSWEVSRSWKGIRKRCLHENFVSDISKHTCQEHFGRYLEVNIWVNFWRIHSFSKEPRAKSLNFFVISWRYPKKQVSAEVGSRTKTEGLNKQKKTRQDIGHETRANKKDKIQVELNKETSNEHKIIGRQTH